MCQTDRYVLFITYITALFNLARKPPLQSEQQFLTGQFSEKKITVESLSLNVSPLYKGSGNIDKAWEKKKISVLEDEDECRESFLSEHDVTTAVITFTLLAAVFPSTKSIQGQAYQHSSRDRRGVYKAPTQSEELLAFNRSQRTEESFFFWQFTQ